MLPRVAWAADPQLEAVEEQAFKQAAALVSPSIVKIQTVGGRDRIGEMLASTGPTSGLVVSSDGYLVSSAFHFASRPSSILVELADGRRFAAQSVATDHLRKLTLLKIDATGLLPARAAEPESIRVGQWAIALGRTYDNPMPSISVGVVSALGRVWGKAIQTDAKVSPVNYGGPLVDVSGFALGLLVPLSPQGTKETAGVEWYDSGIGFAIPMHDVNESVSRLKSGQDLFPGLMGIGLRGSGVAAVPVIDRVRVNSPAERAGFKADDRIVELDDTPVHRHAGVKQVLGRKYADDTLRVTVERGDVKIQKELALVAQLLPYESAYLGILPVREGSGEKSAPGVGVRHVFQDSPASRAQLRRRDRIVGVNGNQIANALALIDRISRLSPGDKATVAFIRDGEEMSADVELSFLPETVPEELPSAAIGPTQQDVQDDDRVKTGRFRVEMPGDDHRYWAYVPEDYNPSYRYGVMVWIHPAGDTMEAALLKNWKSICDSRGMMILAPRAASVAGWTPEETEFVTAAVEDFSGMYSVDPARLFLHSYSTGGRFAYQLAFKQREQFRGIAIVAAPPPRRVPENRPEFRLQFHLACGDKDPLYGHVEATVEALGKLKYPVSLSRIENLAHAYPPADSVREVGRWADCLDRI
jgi:serine protease Do